jgi:glycosyltransferase involved in cell wall biosynthesis
MISYVLIILIFRGFKSYGGTFVKHDVDKVIIVLDPRGLSNSSGSDVIKRHNVYGENLYNLNSKFKLVVISSGDSNSVSIQKLDFLEVYRISTPTFNSYKFGRLAANCIINKKWKVELLIAGDPWESYWSAFFLNRFMSWNTPIQLQIHGDIANPVWREINLRNWFRYYLAKISIPRASSVRAVSNYQAQNLIDTFGIKKQNLDVIPVPINIIGNNLTTNSKRPISIGFVGRIHTDRGIWKLVKLVERLDAVSDDFIVVIAGTGQEKDKFLQKISVVIPNTRIIYLGHLSESELRKVWRKIGVLVSMAPAESYGRVMRESLIAGVPVWATASAGVKDLMNNCKKGEVKILDLSKSNASLDKDFKSLLKTKVSSGFSRKFIKENDTYALKLANSWINTINKAK